MKRYKMNIDNKVIHLSSDADFSAYTYVQVYCGGNTPVAATINGTVVNMTPGNPIDIVVKSISSTANIYLIGFKKIITPQII